MDNQVTVYYSSKKEPGFELEMGTSACLHELDSLNVPSSLVQIKFPGLIWVDFHFEGRDEFWMEIYEAARLSAAVVNMPLAREIIAAAARNFDGRTAEESLSHLKIEWDYICGS